MSQALVRGGGVSMLGVALAFWAACNSSAPAPAATGSGGAPAPAPTAPPVATPLAPSTPPAAPPSADPGFGEVAFKTFESEGTRIVFTSDTKTKVTWHNMVGKAVPGTYTQSGRALEIKWDAASATHYGSTSEKFRQMGPCSMARYERIDLKGGLHDDSPSIYQQVEPRCDTVRLTK